MGNINNFNSTQRLCSRLSFATVLTPTISTVLQHSIPCPVLQLIFQPGSHMLPFNRIYPRFDVTRHVFRKVWHKAKRGWILLHWSWRNSLPVYPELSSHWAACSPWRQHCSKRTVNWGRVLSSLRYNQWAESQAFQGFNDLVIRSATDLDQMVEGDAY